LTESMFSYRCMFQTEAVFMQMALIQTILLKMIYSWVTL